MAYQIIVTDVGKARLAQAILDETPLTLTELAVGSDGTAPDVTQTALRAEQARVLVNEVVLDDVSANRINIEAVIPADVGEFWVREVGVYAGDDLIITGNYPPSYKPIAEEGSERVMVVRIALVISHTEAITLTTDLTAVITTRDLHDNHVNRTDNPHEVTAAQIIPGGTVNQGLFKASNEDGDYEWRDPAEIGIIVDAQYETQELEAEQVVVTLVETLTTGLAVYVGGARLVPVLDYTVDSPTQITLARDYPEGTTILLVNNDPYGEVEASEESIGLVRLGTPLEVATLTEIDAGVPVVGVENAHGILAAARQLGLWKADPNRCAFVVVGGGIQIEQPLLVTLAPTESSPLRKVQFAAATPVDLTSTVDPVEGGEGYYVIVLNPTDNTLTAVRDDLFVPDVNTAIELGGFACGEDGTDILEYSLWDLHWRPACDDPHGMVLVAGKFWADIWFVKRLDALSPPQPGRTIGLNDTGEYPSGYTRWSWYEAAAAAAAIGKRLPTYEEFIELARGVTESSEVASQPATTGYAAGYRSTWGVEQATGHHFIWGGTGPHVDYSGTGPISITGGKGEVFATSARFEAFGGEAYALTPGLAGSRAIAFFQVDRVDVAARFVADHRVIY